MTAPQWLDPLSPEGMREVTAKVLTGTNYRVFYESETRRSLIQVYRELAELAHKHPHNDDDWRASIQSYVREGTPEDKRQRYWLMGIAKKTAVNLNIRVADYPTVFEQMLEDIETAVGDGGLLDQRDMALLLWSGAATLTIRGSKKAKIGKSLENSIARSALTIIGLDEGAGDFRRNIVADEEVERETDAEIRTQRGFVRMEVGLIGIGNSEVISDKVGRMDRNGIILMDILPVKSTAHQTAENRGVKLIQLRNNHPIEELRLHLLSLNVGVQQTAISLEEVETRVRDLPLEIV